MRKGKESLNNNYVLPIKQTDCRNTLEEKIFYSMTLYLLQHFASWEKEALQTCKEVLGNINKVIVASRKSLKDFSGENSIREFKIQGGPTQL